MGRGVSRRRCEGHEEWGFRSRRDRVVEALLVDKMQLHDADAWRPRCSAHREHSRPEEYKVQGSEGTTCSHSAHTAPACVGLLPIARRPVWHAHQPQSTQSTPINPNQPQSTPINPGTNKDRPRHHASSSPPNDGPPRRATGRSARTVIFNISRMAGSRNVRFRADHHPSQRRRRPPFSTPSTRGSSRRPRAPALPQLLAAAAAEEATRISVRPRPPRRASQEAGCEPAASEAATRA